MNIIKDTFIVNVDRKNGSFNTLDDPSERIPVPNIKEKENGNINVFNAILTKQ